MKVYVFDGTGYDYVALEALVDGERVVERRFRRGSIVTEAELADLTPESQKQLIRLRIDGDVTVRDSDDPRAVEPAPTAAAARRRKG